MSHGDTETPGRTALKAWVSAKGKGAQSALAARLGVSEALVNQWRSGSCRPSHVYRDAIELVTGINPRDWETEDERERRKRAIAGPDTTKGAA